MWNPKMVEPDTYTLTVKKEEHEGEMLYVARVEELPWLTAFEDTYDEALNIIFDAIQTTRKFNNRQDDRI